MRVGDVVGFLDDRFPFGGAAEWDPVGLQIGGSDRHAGSVAVCHEVTNVVVAEALDRSVGTLIAYHPLLFEPTTSLVDGPSSEGRALQLARAGTNVIVVHTAMDVAQPGTGDALLQALGGRASGVFAPVDDDPERAIGRIGSLDSDMDPPDFAAHVQNVLGATARTTKGASPIRTVAVVPGSGSFAIDEAAAIADALVTGDVSHHRARAASDLGLFVVDPGHVSTERPAIGALYSSVCEYVPEAVLIDDDPTPWER